MRIKKWITTMALCLVAGAMFTTPAQADAKTKGKLSKNVKWTLSSDGSTLTITGKGTVNVNSFFKDGKYKWPGSGAGQPAVFDKLVFGEGITTVSSGFFDIEGVKTITLPKSFKKIKASNNYTSVNGNFEPFSTTLKKVKVAKKNKKFTVSKGVLYSKDKKTLYIYPSGKTDKQFTVPSKVTTIGRRAFYGSALENVKFGSKVKDIGQEAFAETELKSVTLPASIRNIQKSAFEGSQLTKVELPKGLKTVGNRAFGNIETLSTVIARCNCKLTYSFWGSGCKYASQSGQQDIYTNLRIVIGKELNATIYRLFDNFRDHYNNGKLDVKVEAGNKTYYIKDGAVYAKRGNRLKEQFKKTVVAKKDTTTTDTKKDTTVTDKKDDQSTVDKKDDTSSTDKKDDQSTVDKKDDASSTDKKDDQSTVDKKDDTTAGDQTTEDKKDDTTAGNQTQADTAA